MLYYFAGNRDYFMFHHLSKRKNICCLAVLLALSQFFLQADTVPDEQDSSQDGVFYLTSISSIDYECNLTEHNQNKFFPQGIKILNSGIGNPASGNRRGQFHQRMFCCCYPTATLHTISHLRI